ncbi:MAG: MATE family efflux transporter, partial [Bacilli bacterium]
MRKTFKNKNFIKKVLAIAFPIMLEQLLISSFGIVDTLMVKNIFRGIAGVGLGAQIGTSSGIVMFAFATGVGMYLAQYFGDEDTKNVKNSFSLLIILGFAVAFFFFILGFVFPRQILMLFSSDDQVLDIATHYLRIASFAYFGNLLSYAYVIAYRNVQKPVVSLIMQTTFAALNVLLNYLLIFGIGIFPKMGVEGAALATVISSTLSLVAHIIYAKASKQIFVPNFNNYKVALTRTFNKAILKRSLPLFINESMFSLGTLIYIAIFNKLGPDAYEGYKIADTIVTLWFSISFGMNAAVTAMTGAQLGKGDTQTAKEYGDGFLWIGLLLSIIIGG